jgi:hypothetical protein
MKKSILTLIIALMISIGAQAQSSPLDIQRNAADSIAKQFNGVVGVQDDPEGIVHYIEIDDFWTENLVRSRMSLWERQFSDVRQSIAWYRTDRGDLLSVYDNDDVEIMIQYAHELRRIYLVAYKLEKDPYPRYP